MAQYAPAQVWIAARQFFTDRASASLKSGVRPVSLPPGKPPRTDEALVRNLGIQEGETRVRVRVEPGVQRNTSEIFVVSVKRPAGAASTWPGRKLLATRSSTACCSTSCRPV